jgi:uncharacterized membrane protein
MSPQGSKGPAGQTSAPRHSRSREYLAAALGAVNWLIGFRSRTRRYPIVDLVRGLAVINMIAYHVLFMARQFRLTSIDLETAFWSWHRVLVPIAFLFLAGVGARLAADDGTPWQRLAGHLARLAVLAMAVTVCSSLLFPSRAILWGILHCAFIVLLAMFVALRVRHGLIVLLTFAVATLGATLSSGSIAEAVARFEPATYLSQSLDPQPILPLLLAASLGAVVMPLLIMLPAANWQPRARLARLLTWIGQNSLTLYALHLPAIIGVMILIRGATP